MRVIIGKGSWTAVPDASLADVRAHHDDLANPHNVTAAQVGARPSSYVPSWAQVTGKPTTFPSTWATVSGKPQTFPAEPHRASHVSGSDAITATEIGGIPRETPQYSGDLDLAADTGFWKVSRIEAAVVNEPPMLPGDHDWFYLEQIQRAVDWRVQIARDCNGNSVQRRNKVAGVWTDWEREYPLGYQDVGAAPARHQHGFSAFIGELRPYAGATSPDPNWMIADGSALSRTDYGALFEIIATTYGAGDGTTTFNLPDMRGRSPVGAGQGTGLSARTAGSRFGSESVTLSTAQLPSHGHSVPASGSTNPNLTHNHDLEVSRRDTFSGGGILTAVINLNGTGHAGTVTSRDINATHSHTVPDTNNTGGGGMHTNVPPSLAVNYIIKVRS